MEENIKKFLYTIAEGQYNFLHSDEDESAELYHYNAFLYRLAKKYQLPIDEVYEQVEKDNEQSLEDLINSINE